MAHTCAEAQPQLIRGSSQCSVLIFSSIADSWILSRDVACALEDWNALLFICFPATNMLLSTFSIVNFHSSSKD